MLLPALGERPRRLALEIDDPEIVLRDQHLRQMVVAVNADLHRVAGLRRVVVDAREQLLLLSEQRLRLLACG